jgi:hypothetical protein
VLVEAEEGEEERSSSNRWKVIFGDAALTFEAAPQAARLEENPGGFFEGAGGGGARGAGGAVMERRGASGIERLGATGLWEIASDLAAAARSAVTLDVPGAHSPSKKIRNRRYTAHDVNGSCCSVTLEFPS